MARSVRPVGVWAGAALASTTQLKSSDYADRHVRAATIAVGMLTAPAVAVDRGFLELGSQAFGLGIEAKFGGNLPANFPVIDAVTYGPSGAVVMPLVK